MKLHLDFFETVNIMQINNKFIDLKSAQEVGLVEAAIRIASNTGKITESRVTSFNNYQDVKAIRENDTLKKYEFAFKIGLTTRFKNVMIDESIHFDALVDYLGYGKINESTLTSNYVKLKLMSLQGMVLQEGLFKKIGNAVKSVATKAVSVAKNVGSAVVKGATTAVKAVGTAAKAVGKVAGKALSAVGDFAKKTLGKLAELALGAIKGLAKFVGNNIVKLIDIIPSLMDKLKMVISKVPVLGKILTALVGVGCLVKAFMGGGATANESKVFEAAEVTPEVQEKRKKTGYIFQAMTMFGFAALGKTVDKGLLGSLNKGIGEALAAGNGKLGSILPYLLKNVKVGGIGEKIKEVILNPGKIIANIFTTLLKGANPIIGFLWKTIGGENLINGLLKKALTGLVNKFKEILSPSKKVEAPAEEEVAEEAPAEEGAEVSEEDVAAEDFQEDESAGQFSIG